MGEFGSITFVQTTQRAPLVSAVADLLARLGFGPIEDEAADLDVLLVPATGWTAVVCSEPELLCERPEGEAEPGVAIVARAVARDAFQMTVCDGDSIILLEASARGRVVVSGCDTSTMSSFFHDEAIDEARMTAPRFHVLGVSEELRALVERGGLFHRELVSALVPGIEPLSLVMGRALLDAVVPDAWTRLAFRRTKSPSQRPKPFRWWKGIFVEGAAPMTPAGVASHVLGSTELVRATLDRHLGQLQWREAKDGPRAHGDVGGVEVELACFGDHGGHVRQVDMHVIATEDGLPRELSLRLAGLVAEQGWTVVDWN